MPISGTKGRLRRIEKRALPELKQAIEAGFVTVRKADEMLYWPKAKQRAYIEGQQQAFERRRAVGAAIRQYLDGLSGRRPDLEELRRALARG
jgi:hypothetical protein